jgi:hypothetical protein
MRKTLSLCLYMLLVEVIAVYLVVFPAYAFQVSSSTTGYVRILNLSGASTMFAANRASTIASIASAASAGGAASLALRFVTGAGWVGLGVTAGLLLYEAYYTPTELAAVKAAATVPAHHVVPGVTLPTITNPDGSTTSTSTITERARRDPAGERASDQALCSAVSL